MRQRKRRFAMAVFAATAFATADELWSIRAPAPILGAAAVPVIDGRTMLYAWGPGGLFEWAVHSNGLASARKVASGPFSGGGCATPSFGAILASDTAQRELTSTKFGFIDSGVHLSDCLETTLFGRKGILLYFLSHIYLPIFSF